MSRWGVCLLAELVLIVLLPVLPLDTMPHGAVLLAGASGLAAMLLGGAAALLAWAGLPVGRRPAASFGVAAAAALVYAAAWLGGWGPGWIKLAASAAGFGLCLGCVPVLARFAMLDRFTFATLAACGVYPAMRLRHVVWPMTAPCLLAGIAVAYACGLTAAWLSVHGTLVPLAMLVVFPAALLTVR